MQDGSDTAEINLKKCISPLESFFSKDILKNKISETRLKLAHTSSEGLRFSSFELNSTETIISPFNFESKERFSSKIDTCNFEQNCQKQVLTHI